MYPGNYNSYYDPDYRPPKKRGHRTSTLVLLVLVTALVAGVAGGGFSYYYLTKNQAAAPGPAVTIQTAAPETTATADPTVYASIAEEVAAKASATVVEVTTESKVTHPFYGSYVTGGAGSGVIISADGYIITNNHVIEGTSSIRLRTHDGTEYPARLVGTDSQTDLAVLKVEATGLPAATFADSSAVTVGQPVVAIGNPLGTLGGTVTEGIISARDRAINIGGDDMVLLQTTAAINPGNSGGGLFDRESRLVGVVNAKSTGSDIEGIGFAIPSDTASAVAADLIAHGYVTGRPALGVELVEVTTRNAAYRYGVNEYGVYVAAADNSTGLSSGDRIVSMDGVEIADTTGVKRAIAAHDVGDTVEITVRRGSRNVSVTTTLSEKTGQLADDVL